MIQSLYRNYLRWYWMYIKMKKKYLFIITGGISLIVLLIFHSKYSSIREGGSHIRHIHPSIQNITNDLELPNTQKMSLQKVLEYTCPGLDPSVDYYTHNCNPYKDVALLIVFNTNHYEVIPLLENIYRPSFPKILYCGPGKMLERITKWYSISYISYGDSPKGHAEGAMNYECLTMAMALNLDVKGYLFLGDDVMFYYWNLVDMNTSKIWRPTFEIADLKGRLTKECKYERGLDDYLCTAATWIWWKDYRFETRQALENILLLAEGSSEMQSCIDNLIENNGAPYRVNRGFSDIYYVPKEFSEKFQIVSSIFRQNSVWLEIAVPTILNCISNNTGQLMQGLEILDYGESRNQPWLHYPDAMDKIYLHPSKLGPVLLNVDEFKYYFCEVVMPEVLKYTKELCR